MKNKIKFKTNINQITNEHQYPRLEFSDCTNKTKISTKRAQYELQHSFIDFHTEHSKPC